MARRAGTASYNIAIAFLLLSSTLVACAEAPDTPQATTDKATDGPTTYQHSHPPQVFRPEDLSVGDRVFFDFDDSILSNDAQATLWRLAAWLVRKNFPAIMIEGHTDDRGTREYNLALGMRRAAVVRNYLISLGVPADRMRIISYGSERPAVLPQNESDQNARSQNRRAVIVPVEK